MPRGRKPKDPDLDLQLGQRSDRLKPETAEPLDGKPTAPKHLSKIARAEFNRIVEDLHDNGTLSRVDGSAIALYADAYGDWVESVETLKVEPHYYPLPSGIPAQHQAFKTKATAVAHMLRLLQDFGLTPKARTKVPVVKKDETNEFDGLI